MFGTFQGRHIRRWHGSSRVLFQAHHQVWLSHAGQARLCWQLRGRRPCLLLLQGDGCGVHELRTRRLLKVSSLASYFWLNPQYWQTLSTHSSGFFLLQGCQSLQEGHWWEEHLGSELGHLLEGQAKLLHPRRVPLLLQRDSGRVQSRSGH